jgi:hypothetical protein
MCTNKNRFSTGYKSSECRYLLIVDGCPDQSGCCFGIARFCRMIQGVALYDRFLRMNQNIRESVLWLSLWLDHGRYVIRMYHFFKKGQKTFLAEFCG